MAFTTYNITFLDDGSDPLPYTLLYEPPVQGNGGPKGYCWVHPPSAAQQQANIAILFGPTRVACGSLSKTAPEGTAFGASMTADVNVAGSQPGEVLELEDNPPGEISFYKSSRTINWDGCFGVTTGSWNPSKLEYTIWCGYAVEHLKQGLQNMRSCFPVEPNQSYVLQPVPKFYITTQTISTEIVDIATVPKFGTIDFRFAKTGQTNAYITLDEGGAWGKAMFS